MCSGTSGCHNQLESYACHIATACVEKEGRLCSASRKEPDHPAIPGDIPTALKKPTLSLNTFLLHTSEF